MTPQDLDKMLDNPNLISGIYNYCDRWCERCQFTQRCFLYATENEQRARRAQRRRSEPPPATPQRSDDENAEFWEEIEETLQMTFALLRQMIEESGFDPNSITPEEHAALDEKRRLIDEAVEEHQLATTSEAYMHAVKKWFAAAEGLFEEKSAALTALLRLNVAEEQVEAEAAAITDAVEVIRWYQYFIHVKLRRALSSLLDEDEVIEEDDPERPPDQDVSAKLALIAIDRSLGAWGRLLRTFPQRETETLELLVTLDRLRRAVEQSFPKARAVVRPGFDTLSPLED
jgi:hypothetical protein